MLTERITYLTKHLQVNPKDFHSRRGLIAIVNLRKTQLNFLVRAVHLPLLPCYLDVPNAYCSACATVTDPG